jgi:hypothetical protein
MENRKAEQVLSRGMILVGRRWLMWGNCVGGRI